MLTFILLTIVCTVIAVLLCYGVQILIFGKAVRVVTIAVGISAGLGTANVLRMRRKPA